MTLMIGFTSDFYSDAVKSILTYVKVHFASSFRQNTTLVFQPAVSSWKLGSGKGLQPTQLSHEPQGSWFKHGSMKEKVTCQK